MPSLFEWVLRFVVWLARRPLLRIRIVQDEPKRPAGGLVFEVENSSPTATSLTLVVRSRFWFPEKGRYRKSDAIYDVREVDREIPPFKARLLTASARSLPPGYGFAWFRVYECKSRLGPRARLKPRNAMLEPIGAVRSALSCVGFALLDGCRRLHQWRSMRWRLTGGRGAQTERRDENARPHNLADQRTGGSRCSLARRR